VPTATPVAAASVTMRIRHAVFARDLTCALAFRGGSRPQDVLAALTTGIMPGLCPLRGRAAAGARGIW